MLKSKIKKILTLGLLSNILGVLQSILLARLLGPELRGELAIPLTFVLLVLPLSSYGFKQNLAYLEGKKKVFISDSFLAKLVALCVISSIFFTLLYAFIYLDTFQAMLLQVFILILVRTLADLFSYRFLVLKKAHEITKISFYRSLIEISLVAFLFLSQIKETSIVLNVFILSYILFCVFVVFSYFLNKKKNTVRSTSIQIFSSAFFKRGLGYSIPLFLININTSFDVLMLAKLATSKSVGIYHVAVSVANMLWILPTLLGGLIFSESLDKKLAYLVDRLVGFYGYLLKGSVVLLLPLMLSNWFFITFFGKAFDQSSGIFNILLLGYYAMLIYKISNGVFASHGLVKIPLLIFSLGALFNIGLNLWLIPMYDSKGAAIATLVSYIFCAAMFFFYTLKLKKNNAKKVPI